MKGNIPLSEQERIHARISISLDTIRVEVEDLGMGCECLVKWIRTHRNKMTDKDYEKLMGWIRGMKKRVDKIAKLTE